MKFFKVISVIVASILTVLSIRLCIGWSIGLYNGVTETELLILEQTGVVIACLALIATIWVLEFLLSEVFE